MPDDSSKGPGFAIVFDDASKGPGFGGFTISQLQQMTTGFRDSSDAFGKLKKIADDSGASAAANQYQVLSDTFTTIADLWDAAAKEADGVRSAKLEFCKAAMQRLETALEPKGAFATTS